LPPLTGLNELGRSADFAVIPRGGYSWKSKSPYALAAEHARSAASCECAVSGGNKKAQELQLLGFAADFKESKTLMPIGPMPA